MPHIILGILLVKGASMHAGGCTAHTVHAQTHCTTVCVATVFTYSVNGVRLLLLRDRGFGVRRFLLSLRCA